jgi:glycosyltransferase involved in cell wall biosynthesis
MKIRFIITGFPRKPNGGLIVISKHIENLPNHEFTLAFVEQEYFSFRNTITKVRFFIASVFNEIPKWMKIYNTKALYYKSLPESFDQESINILTTVKQVSDAMGFLVDYKKTVYYAQHWEFWEFNNDVTRLKHIWKCGIPVVTCSNWLKEYVEDLNIDKIEVAENGVQDELVNNITDFGKREFDIVAMLSTVYWKRSDLVISILKHVQEKRKIMGLMPLKIVLFSVSKINTNYLDNASIFINPSRAKINSIYQSSRVMLVTSDLEGFCLPAAEAMSNGCVVVSTNCGGVDDFIINEVNAIITKKGSEDSFNEIINKVLLNKEYWDYLSNNAVNSIDEYYKFNNSAQRFIGALNKIIKE